MSNVFSDLKKFVPLPQIPGNVDIDHMSINQTIERIQGKFNSLETNYLNLVKNNPEYISDYLRHIADPYTVISKTMVNPAAYVNSDTFDAMGKNNPHKGWYTLYFSEEAIEDINRYTCLAMVKYEGSEEFGYIQGDYIEYTNHFQGLQIHLKRGSWNIDNKDNVEFRFILFRHIMDYEDTIYQPVYFNQNMQKRLIAKISDSTLGTTYSDDYLVPMFCPDGSAIYTTLIDEHHEVEIVNNHDGSHNLTVFNPDYLMKGNYIISNALESFDLEFNYNRSNNVYGSMPDMSGSREVTTLVEPLFKKLNNGASRKAIHIPLVSREMDKKLMSVPFESTKDFIVLIDGRKMIPDLDFDIEESIAFGSILTVKLDWVNPTINIRVIKNIPCPNDDSHYALIDKLNEHGIVKANKAISLIQEQTGMMWVDRYYRDVTTLQHVIGDYTHIGGIDKNMVELQCNYLLDGNIENIMNQFQSTKSESEKMMDLLGKDDHQKLIDNYVTNNNLPVIEWKDYWKPEALPAPELIVEGRADSVPVNTYITLIPAVISGTASSYMWVHESGAPVSIKNANATNCEVEVTSYDSYEYATIRMFAFNAAGMFAECLYTITNLSPIMDPSGTTGGIPSKMNINSTATITLNYSNMNSFIVGANGGATITNKTHNSFVINTDGCVSKTTFQVVIDVITADHDNVLTGLPLGGLGVDLYPNSDTAGSDGLTTLTYDIKLN